MKSSKTDFFLNLFTLAIVITAGEKFLLGNKLFFWENQSPNGKKTFLFHVDTHLSKFCDGESLQGLEFCPTEGKCCNQKVTLRIEVRPGVVFSGGELVTAVDLIIRVRGINCEETSL